MKGRPIDQVVYEYLFPRPKQNDPPNFQSFLQRNLIPEVRQETQAFYGHLDTTEAKYPGLDYNHPTHRIRLTRWPWHRRLLRAMNALGLTPAEISCLTKWEGTKWAKEKYEKEQGHPIRDTTADGIPDWVDPEEIPNGRSAKVSIAKSALRDDGEGLMEEEFDSEGGDFESVGVQLNQRLLAQSARRNAGDQSVVLDAEWEQWLKRVLEEGLFHSYDSDDHADQLMSRAISSGRIWASLVPPAMLSAAQTGSWSEIPESLHPLVRHVLQGEQRDVSEGAAPLARSREAPASRGARSFRTSDTRRTMSGLRLPTGDQTTSSLTAEQPGA